LYLLSIFGGIINIYGAFRSAKSGGQTFNVNEWQTMPTIDIV